MREALAGGEAKQVRVAADVAREQRREHVDRTPGLGEQLAQPREPAIVSAGEPVEPLGALTLKGYAQPVPAFRLAGVPGR